jgi:hypothetical protein
MTSLPATYGVSSRTPCNAATHAEPWASPRWAAKSLQVCRDSVPTLHELKMHVASASKQQARQVEGPLGCIASLPLTRHGSSG